MSSVAICIPTYNQSRYLEGSVRSALAQTHPCEVWVSDDASTDDTPAVMARLVAQHPHIRQIRQQQNLGMSGNPRWIVQQPSADFIVKLDSDDELSPNFVEELLAVLKKQPSAGYAHVAVQEITGDGQKSKTRSLGRASGFQSAEESLKASVTGYRVAANICMFRRLALQQVDYYRTDLKFADDWDFAVRLANAGWGNVYVHDVLAKYRVWDTTDKGRSRRKLAEIEGCRRVYDESLVPAFRLRKWGMDVIAHARRRLALRHADCFRESEFSETERRDLKEALLLLGESRALRWKFRWIGTPVAPLFQLPAVIKTQGKHWFKAAIFNVNSKERSLSLE